MFVGPSKQPFATEACAYIKYPWFFLLYKTYIVVLFGIRSFIHIKKPLKIQLHDFILKVIAAIS